jgi:hypothetical protein
VPSQPIRRGGINGPLIYTGVTWHPHCSHTAAVDAEHARQVAQVKGWHTEIRERKECEQQARAAWMSASSRQVPARNRAVNETTLCPPIALMASTISRQVVQRASNRIIHADLKHTANTEGPQKRSAAKQVRWADVGVTSGGED